MTPSVHPSAPPCFQARILVLLVVTAFIAAAASDALAAGDTYRLHSPDKHIETSISLGTLTPSGKPAWSATFHGIPLLKDCALGLQTTDAGELFAGARLLRQSHSSHNERIPVLFGKTAQAENRFEEVRLEFATAAGGHLDVEFRCYNDAVAFRYVIKDLPNQSRATVSDESTGFSVTGNPTRTRSISRTITPHTNTTSPTAQPGTFASASCSTCL